MLSQLNYIDISIIGLVFVLGCIIIFSKEVIKVLVAFMTILFLIGGVFLLFGSGFLFFTQLLIYVGGVTILLVFSIMLSKRFTDDKNLISGNQQVVLGLVVVASLGAGFTYLLKNEKFKVLKTTQIDEVRGLGTELMSKYLITFEVLAVFLLIALIISSVIAGKKTKA